MKILRVMICLCLLLGFVPLCRAQGMSKTVVAEGMAAGSDLKARDEALNRALRRAVEQGVGTLIDTESMTENYQLLADSIYSQVKGYVTDYKVISENNGVGDVYKVKVEATVALARLTKDIKALNIIKEKKGNPRVMVLVGEFVDGLEQATVLVQTEMEREFLAKSFPVVDKAQFDVIKQRDVATYYNDPVKAAVLGKEYGAEVVIVGQANSNLTESSSPYGVAVFAYTADLSAKAIKTDTAALLAVDTISDTQRGSGRMPTANKALKEAGSKLADSMMRGIVEKWRSEVFNTVSIQVIITGLNSDDRKTVKSDLSAIRGIQSVNERSYEQGVLNLNLTIDGAMFKGFEDRLMELPNIKLELTAKTDNRIDLKKSLL